MSSPSVQMPGWLTVPSFASSPLWSLSVAGPKEIGCGCRKSTGPRGWLKLSEPDSGGSCLFGDRDEGASGAGTVEETKAAKSIASSEGELLFHGLCLQCFQSPSRLSQPVGPKSSLPGSRDDVHSSYRCLEVTEVGKLG